LVVAVCRITIDLKLTVLEWRPFGLRLFGLGLVIFGPGKCSELKQNFIGQNFEILGICWNTGRFWGYAGIR